MTQLSFQRDRGGVQIFVYGTKDLEDPVNTDHIVIEHKKAWP